MSVKHYSTIIDGQIDGELPLSVAPYGFGTPVNTSNDGNTPLALEVFHGTSTDNPTQSNVNGVFPFSLLPIELQDKIIGYGMTAIDQEIRLPCLTSAHFRPNVAVGLLSTSHRIHHRAQYELRMQNTFVIGNFGSGLRALASSNGPLKCRLGTCGYEAFHLTLGRVIFDVGEEEMPERAYDKVHAFRCALQYLRYPISINTLHMRFAYHSFRTSAQFSDFASALGMIKVQERLIITGDEKTLDMSIQDIPSKLGLDIEPTYSFYHPFDPYTYSNGDFIQHYEPERQGCKAEQDHAVMRASCLLLETETTGPELTE